MSFPVIARAASRDPCPSSHAPAPHGALPGAVPAAEPAGEGAAHGLVVQLYRAEAPDLVRVVRRRLTDAQDALDLVHDAFVRLLALGAERLHRLEQEQPAAYLNRAARNLALDRTRSDARRSAAAHMPLEDVALAAPDLESQLEARDALRRLEAVMLRLKPKTRAIFIAHRIEGLSYAEIAARSGLTVKGVEKQMSRAIAAVDRALRHG